MGVFYKIHAVALAEDLPLHEGKIESLPEFYLEVDNGYTQVIIIKQPVTAASCYFEFFFNFSERLQLLDCCSFVPGNFGFLRTPILAEQQNIGLNIPSSRVHYMWVT